jgi:Domain of unknown function (DUF4194)
MNTDSPSTEQSADLSSLIILLLKGVLYQDKDPKRWAGLISLQHRVRDYVSVLGLELVLDEAEGYAFLQTRQNDGAEDEANKSTDIPRLVARRQLSFVVSLLLALLRKKLAEFDAGGGETRLVLTRDNIIELIRLFMPDSSNEAKLMDQIDRHINKVVDLGFLRRLKTNSTGGQPSYEVRRIIKAFVDAQWLAEFDQKLEIYHQQLKADSDGE